MDDPLVLSANRYKYWQVDFRKGVRKIVFQDGQILEEELEAKFRAPDSLVPMSVFDWEKWWVMSTTTKGHLIITEGFNPSSPPPLNGRPSVYLDQNHWRTITDGLHDPGRVTNPNEHHAVRDLIRLATDGGVVLPLSAGHMLETAGLHDERRYEVGVAMAGLSNGWQMRNPLDIWKHEVELTIREHLGLAVGTPVLHPITTEPGALFGSDSPLAITVKTSDVDKFMAMLSMPSVVLDTLIDPERIPKNSLTQWIDHNTRITSRIHAKNLPKDQRRRLARRRYWNENIGFYTAAYRRMARSADFPLFSDGELAKLLSTPPMIGLVSELFVRRFMDHQVKWRRNDLIDMFHLSSAAAYADYVCAEAHTGRQLRDIQQALGRPVNVFTTLDDLVTNLRSDGAKTETERSTQS